MYKFIGKYNHMYEFNIKTNANCKESEKSGGEHPCSGVSDSDALEQVTDIKKMPGIDKILSSKSGKMWEKGGKTRLYVSDHGFISKDKSEIKNTHAFEYKGMVLVPKSQATMRSDNLKKIADELLISTNKIQPSKPSLKEIVDRSLEDDSKRSKFIQDSSSIVLGNLRNGSLTLDDLKKARRSLENQSFDMTVAMKKMHGEELDKKSAEARNIDAKREAMTIAINTYTSEQESKNAKSVDWNKVRANPGGSSVRDDPIPSSYRRKTQEETEKYIKENPYPIKPADKEYEEEYEKRTGRKFNPIFV